MLDLKRIRREPDAVRAALARRGDDGALDTVLELDGRRRAILPELESLRARQNEAGAAIAAARSSGGDADAAIAEMREVAARAKGMTDELAEVESGLRTALDALPNLPDPEAPDEDTVLREAGEPRVPQGARDHLELAGPRIDMERAARLSGSRFAYLRAELVFLELALVRWTLEKLRGHGFEPVVPPVLVREEALYGTGFLPDTEQQIYRLPEDDLYLAGTSEVALASLHAARSSTPASSRAATPASRPASARGRAPPAGHARHLPRAPVRQGRDVQLRRAADSPAEHERLLAIEEEILRELEVPYRVVEHRRRRPRPSARAEVRPRGVAARRRAATAS
jgi:seryl-tRNA synthetase